MPMDHQLIVCSWADPGLLGLYGGAKEKKKYEKTPFHTTYMKTKRRDIFDERWKEPPRKRGIGFVAIKARKEDMENL